jgi:hypothetical protein
MIMKMYWNHLVKASLDQEQIRSYILAAAQVEKERIKAELKDQLVFLKLDCLSRMGTNYVGLNARYASPASGLPITSTLAVFVDPLSCRQPAKNLKEMMSRILEDYEVPPSHVLSCVIDNAASMVQLGATINEVSAYIYTYTGNYLYTVNNYELLFIAIKA